VNNRGSDDRIKLCFIKATSYEQSHLIPIKIIKIEIY